MPCIAWASVLLVVLAGCVTTVGDLSAACLEQHPGEIRCCAPGGHIDQGTCCPAGMHVVADVEHPDWRVCVFDKRPCADGGACQQTDADAEADAGADAP